MTPIGWREHASAAPVDDRLLETLRTLPVSLLSDNMARATGTTGLLAYHQPAPLAGTAVTVRTRPGDNLAIHRAFEYCRPGDVLVIDGGGDLTQALMGEIMATYAEAIGVRGLVIDGAIRDVGALRRRAFPVYARGVTHRGPYKSGPGEINVPVSVGGMVVQPGDAIVGDEDGVLAIAPADLAAVVEGAIAQGRKEAQALESIAQGRFDRRWVAARLERLLSE